MKGIMVSLRNAQKVKEILSREGFLDNESIPGKEKGSMIFPLKKTEGLNKKIKNCRIVEREFVRKKKKPGLRELIGRKLSKEEMEMLSTSFDIIGTIAITEVEKGLEKREDAIAEALMKLNPRIKTVLKKEGGHSGIFRRQKMKLLAGESTREAVHRENGVSIKVNVETVYFSPRLSHERERIAKLVRPGEKVLVMFSGAAPYVCVIAKKSKAKEIVGIEINPEGHRYAMENLRLNKIKNARLYLGDVKKVVPKLKDKFNRIIMPLPKTAGEFLPTALAASKKGAVIHFYDFLDEKDLPGKAVEKIERACKSKKRKCKIIRYVKCGQQSPRVFRVCVDFEVI